MQQNKYLSYLGLPALFGTERTKEILHVNPTAAPERIEPDEVSICVYHYTADQIEERKLENVEQCVQFKNSNGNAWINIDGLRKTEVEAICNYFEVHPLVVEDILSINQRPKMDEVEGQLFCLLNMLYYNEEKRTVEIEQISMVLGNHFVISFQEDATRDVFNPLRNKLKIAKSQVRKRGADYLLYAMLDMIVDNYYLVMERLGEQVELAEEEVIRSSNARSLARINQLRKELIVLKRNIAPVRELVNGFLRSESELLDVSDFPLSDVAAPPPAPTADNARLDEIEKATIVRVLESHGGNVSRAAGALGLTRTSLYRRMEKYGL